MTSQDKGIVVWLIAATMHLPLPVCDGDNLTSGQSPAASTGQTAHDFDVDFILLGCDPPDDCDDGPLDDDPENGTDSPFGHAFTLQRITAVDLDHDQHVDLDGQWSPSVSAAIGRIARQCVRRMQQTGEHLPDLSYGQRCGGGLAQLRC